MAGHYRLEAIDDAWSLSFAWNYTHGIATDPSFRFDTMPIIFGKTHALLYSSLLDIFGWTRSHAHMISLILIAISIAIWCRILRFLDWSHRDIALFTFLALLLEPFLGAANLTRPEALCFFLLSSAIFLFVKKRFFLAVLFACFATETHALGLLTFSYFLAYALSSFSQSDWKRAILLGIPALALGIFYFFRINDASLDTLLATIRLGRQFAPSLFGTFSEYFIHRAYHRHVPELIVLLISIFFFIKNKLYIRQRFLSLGLVLTFIASILIKRSDYIYVIYYFPLFIMMMISVAKFYRKEFVLAVFFLALLVPQYLFLCWKQGGFDLDQYVARIRETVPANDIPIMGSSNNWFAFMQSGRFIDFALAQAPNFTEKYTQLYLIEGYFPPYNADHRADVALEILREHYVSRDFVASFDHFGKTITVSLLEKKK